MIYIVSLTIMELNTSVFFSQKTMIMLTSFILILFFVFYNEMVITQKPLFIYIALLIVITGSVIFDEIQAVFIIVLLIIWTSFGERVIWS
jgi:hypothetical protein